MNSSAFGNPQMHRAAAGAVRNSPREGLLIKFCRVVPYVDRVLIALWRFVPLIQPHRVAFRMYPDGRKMWCSMADHTQRVMLFNRFESQESGVVRQHLRPGDIFVDVGAHIGWFTILGAKAVGKGGKVFAFEPFPDNVRLLQANIEVNELDNVSVTAAAVTGCDGPLTVGIQFDSDTGSVTAGPRAEAPLVEVPGMTLDASPLTDFRVRLMKIDVEGFERNVLDGARETLMRTESILIELNRSALAANGSSPEELATHLWDAGFIHQSFIEYPRGGSSEELPNFSNLLAARSLDLAALR